MAGLMNRSFRSAILAPLSAGLAHAAPMPQADFDAAVKAYDERFNERAGAG